MRAKLIDVSLLKTNLHGADGGNADAAPQVAHKIEEAGGVSHVFFFDRRHADGGKRDEDETERQAHDELRPEEVPVAGAETQA